VTMIVVEEKGRLIGTECIVIRARRYRRIHIWQVSIEEAGLTRTTRVECSNTIVTVNEKYLF
jgi:hypothetical protein